MKKVEEKVVRALLLSKDEWMSRTDVGRAVGLKRTPYLSNVLDFLVERGVIERTLGSWGGFSCWFYRANWENVQDYTMLSYEEFIKEEHHNAGEE